ncbi:MAG TPA: type II secretion system protein GspM [candidate division Zixibacteria bacterium]|nr:type II secretion system protein GspM [candidate division Zixibacteria bacterium]
MTKLWQRLSRRERGLVLATGAIIIVALARYLIVGPFLERRDWIKTQLEAQPQLLEKNLRYIARKEELLAALEAARNEIKSREPRLLSGDTPSVNASDLQETVQALAAKEGVQVITTRVLNPETSGTLSKISIQLEIGGQIDQVANLIRGIEASPRMLVVDEINIRSLFRPIGVPQPQGVAAQAAVQNLRVSLTVAGFARPRPAAGEKPGSAPG